MASATQLPGYYTTQSGSLYRSEGDVRFQDEARQATAVVLSMIQENEQASREARNWAHETENATADTAYVFTAVTLDTLTDPWFWLAMNRHSVSYGRGGIRTGGGCGAPSGGGGCDEDTCKAALLLIVIGILVAAFVTSVGLTISQGADAEKARQKADEIKQLHQDTQNEKIKTIYSKVLSEQNKECASQSLKTTFTATCTVGIGLLTASAVFALYAVLSKSPMSPYTSLLAMAGGGAVGGGLFGHVTRTSTLAIRKKRELEMLHELYIEVMNLDAPHPYGILAETGQENATLRVGDYVYTKKGTSFRKDKDLYPPRTLGKSSQEYTQYFIP